MKIPSEITRVYRNGKYNGCKGIDYYEIIRLENKKPVFYIWASKWIGGKKNGHREYKVCWKQTLTHKWISTDIYMTTMSGYQMTFNVEYYDWKSQTYIVNANKLIPSDRKKMPNLTHGYNNTYNLMWKVKQLNKIYKYIPVKEVEDLYRYDISFNIIEFLKMWDEHKELEYLCKSGMGYLWNKKAVYKLLEKKENIKWLLANKKYISSNKPELSYIKNAMKQNLSCEELYMWDRLNNEWKTKETLNYLVKQLKAETHYIGISHDYNDYRDALKTLNVNWNIYPNNLQNAHDKAIGMIKEHEHKERSERIKAISTSLNKKIEPIEKNGLKMKYCFTYKDFQILGRKLENCVARNNYDKKMSEGKCIIFGIWKDNNPVECIEIGTEDGIITIEQCRGKKNLPSKFHDTCMEICQEFIRHKTIIKRCIA